MQLALLFQQLEVILKLDVGETKKGSLEAQVFKDLLNELLQSNQMTFTFYGT